MKTRLEKIETTFSPDELTALLQADADGLIAPLTLEERRAVARRRAEGGRG